MNSLDLEALKLVKKLQNLQKGKILKKYISHIRFPFFKNLARDACIDFPFPITALVGPNGCGKTSALHALYGAPRGKSTSDFWFSTEIDPIKEGAGQPNRFIYGHYLEELDNPVETRKARVGKSSKRRVGYFEPTKATSGDSMDMSFFPTNNPLKGQSKDRWNPVERPLIYINFRSELSAFDQFFYFGNLKVTKTLKNKQDVIIRGSKNLTKTIRIGSKNATLYGKIVVSENRKFSKKELKFICEILGKEYSDAWLVKHKYYGKMEGLSVRFQTNRISYSEAFAGSGELAVASLVAQLSNAENYSLVLLDEPEVSLHPGAQERLLVFLLKMALEKKLQIIFTTHSSGLIRHLPENAIKVFYETPEGLFDVLNASHPYAAFNRLGAIVPEKIKVLVEDRLAKHVVELALLFFEEDQRSLFEINFLPGGSKTYYSQRIPTLMHQNNHIYILLDGDQRPDEDFINPDTIPESDNSTLNDVIKRSTRCKNIQLGADGGNDSNINIRTIELQRQYLKFLYERVKFLPKSCPEEIVFHVIEPHAEFSKSQDAKKRLSEYIKNLIGSDKSEDIDNSAKTTLAQNRIGNEDLKKIAELLELMLKSLHG